MNKLNSIVKELTFLVLLGVVLSHLSNDRVYSAEPAPAFPGKKGFRWTGEVHGLTPRLLGDRAGLAQGGFFSVTDIPASPDTTELRVLALLLDFSDFSFIHERTFVERHLFFLTQYFSQVSGGRLEVEVFVPDTIFTLPRPMVFYGRDDNIGLRLVQFARDAVEIADSLIDFAQYDGVMLVHAGQGQEADVLGNSPELLWSAFLGPYEFAYYLPDSLGDSGVPTNDTLPGGEPKYINMAIVAPEDQSQDGYFFSPLGVYVHEFGHFLGLPDLYDTEPSGNADSQGIGNWGLMGTGLWNGNGFSPAEPCAWSKAVLGWKPVHVISASEACTLSFSSGANPQGAVALIPTGGREYFLLENRLKDPNGNELFDFDDANGNGSLDVYTDSYEGAEFDFFLPDTSGEGSGLLIWHVDEQQIEAWMPYNMVNADKYHKGVDLEEADGMEDLDEPGRILENYGSADDSFREGNNQSFTPFTVPNSNGSYGGRTYVFVEGIGSPGLTMGFTVSFGMKEDGWPLLAKAAFGRNHPNAADLDGDGTIEIVACDVAGNLYVRKADGSRYLEPNPEGEPSKVLGDSVFSSPAIGDIDGDGTDEVVVVSASGIVFAWNGEDLTEVRDGDENPGTDGVLSQVYPVGETAVVLADLDSDGGNEILFGSSLPSAADSSYQFNILWVPPASVSLPDLLFPLPVSRAPLACDVNNDGAVEVLVPAGTGDGSGRLYLVSGFPVIVEPQVSQRPMSAGYRLQSDDAVAVVCQVPAPGEYTEFVELVAGDLDRDGRTEIVGADTEGMVHAFHLSPGVVWPVELPGWPLSLVSDSAAAVSLGDIDSDGRLEVFAACGGKAFAVNYNGTLLPGWPPRTQTRTSGQGKPHGPLCVELTGDDASEFVGALNDGRITAFEASGRVVNGWPIVTGSAAGTSPIVEDIDGDGLAELVVARDVGVGDSLSGQIDVWQLQSRPNPRYAWWPRYRRDAAHSGVMPDSLSPPSSGGEELVSAVFSMPNPARGEGVTLHYLLSEEVDRVRIEIYDLSGRLVYSASPAVFPSSDNTHKVAVGGYTPGIYVCRIEASAGGRGSKAAYAKFAILK
ncbi:MAG: M6 family metalloprotease domain-containing protein [Candidatus Eisenbacteria bacterium]